MISLVELSLLILLLGGGVIAYLRERQLNKTLGELEAAARTVAEGLTPVPLPKETGVHATFNQMSAAVATREQKLERGGLAALQLVSRTVDEREEFTRGRSHRVAGYAAELAKRAGLSPEEVQQIADAASLIDIGKIAISDAILKKPSALDIDERRVMETHPAIGECFVRRMPGLAYTLPGILHHHERWDGSGYPSRLAGDKIPLMARILAIADSYDAMTSERPYRSSFSSSVALGLIEQAAGRQFDPELAALFVQIHRSKSQLLKAETPALKAA
jgi:HD-GYP domain-containing protein (c-di-GMP phosphodiesterase class II)